MIGQSYIFPWSRLWARESRFNTPSGGLILHWICSTILIIIAVNIPRKGEYLPGNLQAYSHGAVARKCSKKGGVGSQTRSKTNILINPITVAITIAFCYFTPPKDDNNKEVYQWSLMKYRWCYWLFI